MRSIKFSQFSHPNTYFWLITGLRKYLDDEDLTVIVTIMMSKYYGLDFQMFNHARNEEDCKPSPDQGTELGLNGRNWNFIHLEKPVTCCNNGKFAWLVKISSVKLRYLFDIITTTITTLFYLCNSSL